MLILAGFEYALDKALPPRLVEPQAQSSAIHSFFTVHYSASMEARNSAHNTLPSFCDSSTQDLRPEESTLGLLNHLLVHTLRWMVHYNRAGLVIKLRIDSGVSDQVDNPLLAVFFRQSKSFRKIP